MSTSSTLVTVVTHLQVHDGKLDDFRAGCRTLIERTSSEKKCVFMQVAFDGRKCVSHEGYADAAGVMEHLENVRATMEENMAMADLNGVELYGPADELDRLREPLGAFSPDFYSVDFRYER